MKRTLISLSVLASALGAPLAQAEVTSEQLQALEARIAELEAGGNAPAAAVSDKIKINGFMSAGFGRADIDDFRFDDLGEDMSHTADSIVGLQVEGKVNEEMKAVLQLVARGEDDFAPAAEWAYIAWQPTENDEFRAGRMRTPIFMLSEYLEVGYSYPWVTPPVDLYYPGFPSSYDGLAWVHKFNAGGWQHDVNLNWGSLEANDYLPIPMDATNAWAAGIESSVGDWQFGLHLSGVTLNTDDPLVDMLVALGAGAVDPIDDSRLLFQSVGVQYDNGTLMAMVEAAFTNVDGLVPDTESAFVTLGYRFGKVMPHITYSSSRTTDEEERPDLPALAWQDTTSLPAPGPSNAAAACPLFDPDPNASLCLAIIPNNDTPFDNTDTLGVAFPADTLSRLMNKDQTSVTLGVRYDFLANAAVKFDWTRVLDTHGTFGQFEHVQSNLLPTAVLPDDEVDIFRVAVDVVF